METLATIAFTLGVVAYSVACTLFFLALAGRAGKSAKNWAAIALTAGAAFHAVHVVAASFFSNVCPVESVPFALSLAAWVVVVVFLVLRPRHGLDALGTFVAPIALTFLVGAHFVENQLSGASAEAPEVSRTLLALHITANVIGFGFVLLAGGACVFYLMHERRLKAKKLGLGKLPTLDALDRTGHRLLLIGFPLLTFGVVTGAMFVADLGPAGSASFVRALLGYATWLLVAAVLLLRSVAGWRGRRLAYGTLAGLAGVTLVFVFYLLRPFLGGHA